MDKLDSKISITEEMRIYELWYKEAKEMTLDKLPDFINKLLNDYNHDYGTICHAVAAGSVAAAWSMNNHPAGGLTGFQGGAVMWKFIRHWKQLDSPMSLRIYEDMLYPQYSEKFQKTISKDTWEWLQERAKQKLESVKNPHSDVEDHWKSIVEGIVPFGYSIGD